MSAPITRGRGSMTVYPSLSVTPCHGDGSPETREVGYFNDLEAARRYSEFLIRGCGHTSTVIEGTGWNGEFKDEDTPTASGLTLIPGGAA